jgi:hypothetical protein
MSPPPKARGTRRSSVSRRWKRATEAALAELMARDLSDLDVAVVMVDGIELAGQCVVAALVVTTDGTKVPVGLWLGDTENKTVVTAYWPTWWPGASAARRACSSSSTGPRPGDRRGQGVRGKSSCTKVHFAQAAKCPGPPASRAGGQGRPAPGPGLVVANVVQRVDEVAGHALSWSHIPSRMAFA